MKKINLDFIEKNVKKENEKITEQDMAHYLRNKGNEIYELYKYINKLAEDLEKGNHVRLRINTRKLNVFSEDGSRNLIKGVSHGA